LMGCAMFMLSPVLFGRFGPVQPVGVALGD
jgi:hypothetical protein